MATTNTSITITSTTPTVAFTTPPIYAGPLAHLPPPSPSQNSDTSDRNFDQTQNEPAQGDRVGVEDRLFGGPPEKGGAEAEVHEDAVCDSGVGLRPRGGRGRRWVEEGEGSGGEEEGASGQVEGIELWLRVEKGWRSGWWCNYRVAVKATPVDFGLVYIFVIWG
ncbi:hypothetical protein M0R45_003025 [Rubus argutus]|uniref:Uncharacterized protein n=1 Tax=Rubus argutus TaxID=59490 RepID=A0AAW1YGR9_RUBAR